MAEQGPAPSIVLVGMMGSGKTAVGRRLRRRTGWPYLDNDTLVRTVTNRQPAEIDREDGEAALHEAEASALRHALQLPPPQIVGAAAWAIEDASLVTLLEGDVNVVYLRAQPATLHRRIGSGAGRRADATDLEWLQARFEERDERYRSLATVIIDTDDRSVPGIVTELQQALALPTVR